MKENSSPETSGELTPTNKPFTETVLATAAETWILTLFRIHPDIHITLLEKFAVSIFGMMIAGKFKEPTSPVEWKQLFDAWLVATNGGNMAEPDFITHMQMLYRRAHTLMGDNRELPRA
jgi:hypothetical protein